MMYIFILIVFIAIVTFIQKAQKNLYTKNAVEAQNSDPFKSLAEKLGLQYEFFTPQTGKNVLYSNGSRIFGNYQNIPVEAIYAVSTQSEPGLSRYTASYTMQKTITWTVKNREKKEFQILPQSLGVAGGVSTGNDRFESVCSLFGDLVLPKSLLDFCAQLGWMNLSLKDDKLIFNDTFYDEMKGISGGIQMMNAEHPIWKSTPKNTRIDLESAQHFFDEITQFAKTL